MQVFDDVRVLEFCGDVAGAFAGKLFADFGADVIKVEPPAGDPLRREGPFLGEVPDPDTGAAFCFFNRNKRSVTLDVDSSDGTAMLLRLAGTCDLVLDSAPPGLAPGVVEAILAGRRGCALASLTPFGPSGPYRDFQATETVLNAVGGPMVTSGVPDRSPLTKPPHLVAGQVGSAFATAALAALMAADGGDSQRVEVSAVEALAGSFDRRAISAITYQLTGEAMGRDWGTGRDHLPRGVHRCRDGCVEIATTPHWVPRMLATLADPGLDRYFAGNPRAAFDPATVTVVSPVLRDWLAARTRAECFEEATLAHGWPVYPLNEPGEVLTDTHFTGRGCFVEVDHPSGRQLQLGPPWRMAVGGFALRRPAPALGEHNVEVWAGECGLDMTLLAQERALGVL